MKIILRYNKDIPFFYTPDGVIHVSTFSPEQLLDDKVLNSQHKIAIERAERSKIIDVVRSEASPAASVNSDNIKYSVNGLRKALDKGEITKQDAAVLLATEQKASSPRISIIKELKRCLA